MEMELIWLWNGICPNLEVEIKKEFLKGFGAGRGEWNERDFEDYF